MGGVAAGMAVAAVVGGTITLINANNAKKDAEERRLQGEKEMDELEANRQDIINPYDEIEDLSGIISNPFANLGVATQAAQMQVEEADIALANTLDTLRATGASAGGATALAQAALKSKMGVSASIEQQEAANEKLKAQGEQQMNQAILNEKQRVQQARVSGEQFVFGSQETREMQQLNRTQSQIDLASNAEAAAAAAEMSAVGDITSGVTSAYGTYAASQP